MKVIVAVVADLAGGLYCRVPGPSSPRQGGWPGPGCP